MEYILHKLNNLKNINFICDLNFILNFMLKFLA